MPVPKPEPFRIAVPDTVLADLRRRLADIRWPAEPEAADWRLGSNLAYMQTFAEHWRDRYDWRRWEVELNRFPQYRVPLSDPEHGELAIHFLMERGSGAAPLPLLITHGWPGSVAEFLRLVEPLAHPERFGGDVADAFTVVCPSLPGYGFSTGLTRPINPRRIAALWRRLMVDMLGFTRFVAQGGDWGSVVTSWLGVDHADAALAIHLNMLGLRPYTGPGTPPLTDAERAWIGRTRKRLEREGGYQQIQGTKPQSLAFGLSDSPIGLAAWIVEKFHGWPGASADQPPPFAMDELITNVMLYWVTNSIASANWMYWSVRQEGGTSLGPDERVEVPTAFAFFPHDLFPPPPTSWLKRGYNLMRRTDFSAGGHFAALEKGADLMADMRAFFRDVRTHAQEQTK